MRAESLEAGSDLVERGAGLCALVAGLLFIGVQVDHPHLGATSITTTDVSVRASLRVPMAALALVGITGEYLRQVKRTGVLGLLGSPCCRTPSTGCWPSRTASP